MVIFQVNLGLPVLLDLRMMEVVVTTAAIRHAKLQSNCHHQQTNTQLFYRMNALPVAQPTVSKHRGEKLYLISMSLIFTLTACP